MTLWRLFWILWALWLAAGASEDRKYLRAYEQACRADYEAYPCGQCVEGDCPVRR